MNLEQVLLQGLAAARPAATAVAAGTLYYATDTFATTQSDGAVWSAYSGTSGSLGINQLTGDVTAGPGVGSQAATIANNAVTTAKILNDNVTYPKIQNVSATDRLLGRDTAAAGDIEEIPVSSGLEFTGGPGLRTTAAIRTTTIGITVDNGSSVVTTGAKGFFRVPQAATITKVTLIANAAGDVVFDIKKSTYAGFPTQASIVASAPPTLSGVQKNEDATLTGWTTAITAGDVIGYEITGTPATITRVTLILDIVLT